jgi:hypothetical protein
MARRAVRIAWPVLAALAAACPGSIARAQHAEPQQRYRLSAKLDVEHQRVDGSAFIDWRNPSRVAVHELYFHLYANAFAHAHTVFMREGGARIRDGRLERKGGITLQRLRLADGTDLLKRADTALVARDATQMRVALPHAVAPGEQLQLEVAFQVRMPSLVARMGAAGDFFMVAQWFPKLARLEPDGRWASFPYHGLGEFYADFADYELAVEVPARYVVAAPGELVERRALRSGARIEHYRLERALDVAFAADPGLRRVQARAPATAIEVYAPAGQLGLAQRQAALLRAGLQRFGERLGR